jgi:Ethylbenzene dehydrogenase/Prokaryotic cytochrome b561
MKARTKTTAQQVRKVESRMSAGPRPTTDSGTVVVHAVLVVSCVALVITGMRIAIDDPELRWLAIFDPILPMGHPWFWHLAAAVVFAATLAGYAVYLVAARLTARIQLDAARLSALRRPGKARWAACNTMIYWGLMTAFACEIVSGVMLFGGADRVWLSLHREAMWACLVLIGLHVACHMAIGGTRQLTRILRPAALVVAPPPPDFAELLAEQLSKRANPPAPIQPARPAQPPHAHRPRQTLNAHPAATGIAVAAAMSATAISLETATRPVLHISEIVDGQAPVLDGDLSDPVWTKAKPAVVMTSQGGDFGGTGQSQVEIRAVHDGTFVYFAVVWTDPTRSLKHLPLLKTQTGWRIATTGAAGPDSAYEEDKFALLFARDGGAIHLSAEPRSDRPPGSTGRGLHYTTDGSVADVWVWRATHGGPGGYIENAHIGAAAEPTREQIDGRERYTGGFALDPGAVAPYRSNAASEARGNGDLQILPVRLPRDLAATQRALGRVSPLGEPSDVEGARWWMSEADSQPYTKAADDKIPPGTAIPGVILTETGESGRTGIRGVARWAAGRWTLEVARRMRTGSSFDVPIKTGTLLWVAAFDHSETRHTRHLRPLRLEVD